MNEHLNFWRIWPKKEKYPLFIILGLAIASLVYCLIAYTVGLENILHWNIASELHEKIISTQSFFYDDFKFSASSPVWYIKERYLPSLVEINSLAFFLLLGFSLIGLSLILIGLSRLKGIWFFVGALVLGGILISFRAESIFLANANWPFLVSFVFTGGFYYFTNIYGQKYNTSQSLSFWIAVWLILWFLATKFSTINQPSISLAAYGLIAFLVISGIFVFLISHEIFAGLVWLVSKNAHKDKSSLAQFLIITIVYFANVVLIFLENSNKIDRSTFVLPSIFLYSISTVLGFWGFRQISEQRNWFSYQRTGAWIYLGLALITSTTFAFIYATGNDPLIELIEDFICIAQLAVGITFFFYIITNYLQLFKQGLDVHKVLYKSPYNRLIYARTVAVFVVLWLFSMKNFYSYYQAEAGIANTIADFYLKEGDLKAAETYYKSSTHYDLYNHKANFSLASLALSQNDKINAAFFFNQAITKSPSPYAYAGLSASLENENMYFDALFSLQKGIKKFPNSSQLFTNLAFLQEKSKMTDSVLINLDKALKICKECETENTNFLAFWIENAKLDKLEEMSKLAQENSSNSFKANKLAIERILEKESTFENFEVPKDSILDMSRAALLFNAISNPKTENKTKIDSKTLVELQKIQGNDPIFEELSWAYAQQNYYRQKKAEGTKQLFSLAEANTKYKNIYNQNLGLWLMKEGVLDKAIERLKIAGDITSSEIISKADLRQKVELDLQKQAANVTKELNEKNYEEILSKAPFNPYVIEKISNFLTSKTKNLEAYNVAFYASEVNSGSALIWKTYIKKALAISQLEYAQDGLKELEKVGTTTEILEAKTEIEKQKQKISNSSF